MSWKTEDRAKTARGTFERRPSTYFQTINICGKNESINFSRLYDQCFKVYLAFQFHGIVMLAMYGVDSRER